MTIELQLKSITIPLADVLENYPHLISALQPYLPVQKPKKQRKPRKKKETVGNFIDALIDSIDSGSSD